MQKWKERKKERNFLEWKWPKSIPRFFFQRRQINTSLAIDMNENKGKKKKPSWMKMTYTKIKIFFQRGQRNTLLDINLWYRDAQGADFTVFYKLGWNKISATVCVFWWLNK